MTEIEIIEKVLDKVIDNGFNFTKESASAGAIDLIFSHKFAKAFWGKEKLEKCYNDGEAHNEFGGEMEYCYDEGGGFRWKGEAWKYHIQKMSIEKNPYKYLEKFL